jgi:hypothetical protein
LKPCSAFENGKKFTEKLIEQYDPRLKEKDEQIVSLREEINKFKQKK